MSPREFESDETLEKYKKAEAKTEAEKPSEIRAEEQKEFEAVRKEKKLKKPGSVSRFFNQFGIGKYWERMNDYFEQEEKMEKEEAEREASKETAEDIEAAAKTEVSDVKAKGQEIPKKILESAARAGASVEEAAPTIAEAKAEEAAIEQEAEAAKTGLIEDVEILEQKPLLEEISEKIKTKYEKASLKEVDKRIKFLEDQMRAQDVRHEEIEQGLKSGKFFKSDKLKDEQEKMEETRSVIKAERDSLFKVKEEKMKMVDLPPGEEFEAIDKEHEEKLPPSIEKIKPVEVLAEEVIESAEEEMEKAKVEPVSLVKRKKAKRELPSVEEEELEAIPAQEFLGDSGFKIGDKVVVVDDSGKLDSGWAVVNFGKNKETMLLGKTDKDGEPIFKNVDLNALKKWQKIGKTEAAGDEWLEKGAAASRAREERIKTKIEGLREKGKRIRAQKGRARVEAAFKIAEPEEKKPKAKKTKAA
ncbi:MAG: hypothetical protein WC445_02205 [Patescibacteria group bacterium]